MSYITPRCDLGYHASCNDNSSDCTCCNCDCHTTSLVPDNVNVSCNDTTTS